MAERTPKILVIWGDDFGAGKLSSFVFAARTPPVRFAASFQPVPGRLSEAAISSS